MKSLIKLFTLIFVFAFVQTGFAQKEAKMIKDVTVVQLSQIPGEYETTSLNLAPGKYIFEVTNKNVSKELGFYLTPKSDAKAQVTNSGLSKLVGKGETARTGIIELKSGEYQYSCPLNPTPHYSIKVHGM